MGVLQLEQPSSFPSLTQLALGLGALWIAHRALGALALCYRLRSQPGGPMAVRPLLMLWPELLPTRRGFNYSSIGMWRAKADILLDHRSSVVLFRGLLPTPSAACIVGDAEGARALFRNTQDFCKPVEDYAALCFFGTNVVASEHAEWRRLRRLTIGSFTERNNELVWAESQRLLSGMFAALEHDAEVDGSTLVLDSGAILLRMTLMIFSAAALGRPSDWPTSNAPALKAYHATGSADSFLDGLQRAFEGTLIKLTVPNWAYSILPFKRLGEVKTAYEELDSNFREMIADRKRENGEGVEHNDLFSALLKGVKDEDGEGVLATEEIVANIYVFLLAGHETTAHTLTFLLTLLALYPQHQQTLFDESRRVFSDSSPQFSHFSQLPYAMASIQEALRLYPPVILIPKVAMRDALVPCSAMPAREGEEPVRGNVFVPKGSKAGVLVSALHYNELYWKEPFEFDPKRFIDKEDYKWNRDAWVPFSGGGRQCMGQRFALVEMVSIISTLISQYTLEIAPSRAEEYALRPGEGERERRERVFGISIGLSLTPRDLPIVFRPRERSA